MKHAHLLFLLIFGLTSCGTQDKADGIDQPRRSDSIPDWVVFPEEEWQRITPEEAFGEPVSSHVTSNMAKSDMDAWNAWVSSMKDSIQGGAFFGEDHSDNRWGVAIEPLLSLDYTYLWEQGLNESGIGPTGLQLEERSNSLFASELGVRLSHDIFKHRHYSFLEWADGIWTPEFSARWRETWTGWERDLESRMQGGTPASGSFEVEAQDARRGVLLGARLSFQPLRPRTTIALGYEVFWGAHNLVQTLDLKLVVPF